MFCFMFWKYHCGCYGVGGVKGSSEVGPVGSSEGHGEVWPAAFVDGLDVSSEKSRNLAVEDKGQRGTWIFRDV